MNCEKARLVLMDYVMEEVSEPDRDAIRQHVECCAGCAEQVREHRGTLGMLARGAKMEEVPQRFRLVAEPVRWWSGLWRNAGRLAFAGAGMACLAIGMLGVFRATLSYESGHYEIVFGGQGAAMSPAVAPVTANGVMASGATELAAGGERYSREDVIRLVNEVVRASEHGAVA